MNINLTQENVFEENEIIFDKKHTLNKDDVQQILDAGVNSVTVYKKGNGY